MPHSSELTGIISLRASHVGRYCLAIPLNVGMIFTNIHHKRWQYSLNTTSASPRYCINISFTMVLFLDTATYSTNKSSISKGPPIWRKPFQCRCKTNKKTTDKIMGPTLKSQTYTTNLPNKASRWWETLCVVIFIGNLWFAFWSYHVAETFLP